MIRGTTPRIIFKINNLEDFSEIKDVWILIKNKNCSLLNKSYLNEEIDLDGIYDRIICKIKRSYLIERSEQYGNRRDEDGRSKKLDTK